MPPGRKPESAPEGMMLPREAADALGISVETVKKYIKGGVVLGEYRKNSAGEYRYYASKPSVEAYKKSAEIDRVVERGVQLHGDTQEVLLNAFGPKLDRLLVNQERVIEQTERQNDLLEKLVEDGDGHYKRVAEFLNGLELPGKELVKAEVEAEPKRVWWKRWLGIR